MDDSVGNRLKVICIASVTFTDYVIDQQLTVDLVILLEITSI